MEILNKLHSPIWLNGLRAVYNLSHTVELFKKVKRRRGNLSKGVTKKMTQEIPKQEWTQFFDDLTKRRFDWQTKIEIISEEIGDQILDEGLPLKGITAELRNGESVIEILVGQDSGHHQTHNISNPTKVAYLSEQSAPSDIVEIEEMDGTKTLIHIIAPMPLVVNDAKSQDMQAA